MTQVFSKRNGVPWGWLRFCGACGRPWGHVDMYCESCWQGLWELKKPSINILPMGQIHFSLFSWKKELRLKNLVYSLKQGGCKKGFERLAWEMSFQIDKKIGLKDKYLVFVPAPPKLKQSHDHAYELANALCKIWGGELWQPFCRKDDKSQKKMSRPERMKTEYEYCDKMKPKRIQLKTIVFVDDVLTTGSSAKAALLHLEKFSKTMVWTVVRRPLFDK